MKNKFNIGDRVEGTEVHKGKQGRVIGFSGTDVTVEFDEYIGGHTGSMCGVEGKNGHCWHCLPWAIKPVEQNRVIFNDKTTVLIKDGKKYISECKDGDTYDKEKGLLLCLAQANGISYKDLQEMIAGAKDCNAEKVKEFNVGDRVMAKTYYNCNGKIGTIVKKDNSSMPYLVKFDYGSEYWLTQKEISHVEKTDDKPQVREVERKAKVGEYIKCVNPKMADGYGEGDILRVKEASGAGVFAVKAGTNEDSRGLWHSEYVVLENYKPYKITLSEFWESKDNLAIHCKTATEAKKLLKAFDKAGKRWRSGSKYTEETNWYFNKEKTAYTNNNCYGDIDGKWVKDEKYTIYEFNEVDLEN